MSSDRVLSHEQARRLYDRIGAKLDTQSFYEDPALRALIAHADFGRARRVFEFGCGTGRFAAQLLAEHLPPEAELRAIDLSPTMVALSQQRLAEFGERANVLVSDGAPGIDAPDESFDRVVSTYVLDLLSVEEIRRMIAEAHRVLVPGGRLCLASCTPGRSTASRILTGLWSRVQSARPALVGGCRPIGLRDFVGDPSWRVDYVTVISAFAVPSEVLIATRI